MRELELPPPSRPEAVPRELDAESTPHLRRVSATPFVWVDGERRPATEWHRQLREHLQQLGRLHLLDVASEWPEPAVMERDGELLRS